MQEFTYLDHVIIELNINAELGKNLKKDKQ
jgi:hypothetical protein